MQHNTICQNFFNRPCPQLLGWSHVNQQRKVFYSYTVFPGSSDPFCIVTYYIKWVTTSWTHSTVLFLIMFFFRCFNLRQKWETNIFAEGGAATTRPCRPGGLIVTAPHPLLPLPRSIHQTPALIRSGILCCTI